MDNHLGHTPLWYFVGHKETRRWQKTLRFAVLCALIICGMFVHKIDTSAAETIQTPPAKVDVNYLLKNPSKIKQQINKENITQVLNDFNRTNKVPLAQWLYTGSGLKPEHAKSRLEDFCNAAGFGYDKKKAIFEAVQSGNYTQANTLMGGSSQQTTRTTGNSYARTANAPTTRTVSTNNYGNVRTVQTNQAGKVNAQALPTGSWRQPRFATCGQTKDNSCGDTATINAIVLNRKVSRYVKENMRIGSDGTVIAELSRGTVTFTPADNAFDLGIGSTTHDTVLLGQIINKQDAQKDARLKILERTGPPRMAQYRIDLEEITHGESFAYEGQDIISAFRRIMSNAGQRQRTIGVGGGGGHAVAIDFEKSSMNRIVILDGKRFGKDDYRHMSVAQFIEKYPMMVIAVMPENPINSKVGGSRLAPR